jgi:hypothetical protein
MITVCSLISSFAYFNNRKSRESIFYNFEKVPIPKVINIRAQNVPIAISNKGKNSGRIIEPESEAL